MMLRRLTHLLNGYWQHENGDGRGQQHNYLLYYLLLNGVLLHLHAPFLRPVVYLIDGRIGFA